MKLENISAEIFERMRGKRPLVHHITNFVVMNDTANFTLAIGASPIMAHSCNELDDLTSISGALVINIGTLGTEWVDSMNIAAEHANKKGVPVLLDPVGAGATLYRTEVSKNMLSRHKISVLKGNLGEISSLTGLGGIVSGVDSLGGGEPADVVKESFSRYKTITAVTGKNDYVSNGKEIYIIKNDSEYLPRITGSGCMAGSIIAAFLAVEKDYALATACGLGIYSMAGEMAERSGVKGPAEFRMRFMDTAYNLSPDDIVRNIRIEKLEI